MAGPNDYPGILEALHALHYGIVRQARVDAMKREKQISKPVRARERVACGLDHPAVLEILRRHEQAVATRKHLRSVKRSTR